MCVCVCVCAFRLRERERGNVWGGGRGGSEEGDGLKWLILLSQGSIGLLDIVVCDWGGVPVSFVC